MALKKDIELFSGVVTSHHRIVSANVNWFDKTLVLMVGHYLDVNARLNGKSPIESTRYRVREDSFPLTDGGAIQNEMYEYLKTLPEYKDAEDEII